MATQNYGLHIIDKKTEVVTPDRVNDNSVKIDAQLKVNEVAIQGVDAKLANINVTTDVEEVVNRRVNSERTKSLNTILIEVKDAINSVINAARDNIKAHVTSEDSTVKTHVTSTVVGARDNVNNTVTGAKNEILNKLNSVSVIKNISRGVVKFPGNTTGDGSSTVTIPISVSNPNKCSVGVYGTSAEGGSPANVTWNCYVLSLTTTQLVLKSDYGQFGRNVSWEIVEFN